MRTALATLVMALGCSSSSFEPAVVDDSSTDTEEAEAATVDSASLADTAVDTARPKDTGPVSESFTFPLSPASLSISGQTTERALATMIATIRSGTGLVDVTAADCGSMSVGVEVDGTRVATFNILSGSGASKLTWKFDSAKLVSTSSTSHKIRYVALDDLSAASCLGQAAHVNSGTVTIVGDL